MDPIGEGTVTGQSVPDPIHRHPLACVRGARGWTHQDVADVIAASARHLKLGGMAARREKIWRWEHLGVVPDMRSQRALAAALDVPTTRLGTLLWPKWLPVDQEFRTGYAWTDDGALAAINDTLEYAVQDRRGFLALTGALATSLANGWASASTETVRHLADRRGRIDTEILTWIEHKIPGLRRMDDRLGGEVLRNLVDADLRVVYDLLAKTSLVDEHRRRLHRAAAELGQLAGWVSFDSGLHAAGQRYYQAGLHAAQSADDHLLGANVLACMSFQSALTGHPRDGIALAVAAQDNIRRFGGPRVKAMVATREARAYAKTKEESKCAKALRRAERHLEAADRVEGDPEWVYYFDEAELTAQAGACWLDLHQPHNALALLDHALASIDPGYVRDRTIYQVRRAAAHLQLGELEYSCELLQSAAGLAAQSRSARSVATIHTLRAKMNESAQEPAVKDLDDHLVTLSA